MKKFKIAAGITWAFICLILIIIFFPKWNKMTEAIGRLQFMKINPNYTGGEIAQQFIMPACTLDIRKPVFDGLFKERNRGFVQIDWRGKLPDKLIDTIDYDLDKSPDFIIEIDRASSETNLNRINSKVKDVSVSTPTSYGWAVRINLKK
jgi:hypothetical protein